MKDTSKKPTTIADSVVEKESFESRSEGKLVDGKWMCVYVQSNGAGYVVKFDYGDHSTHSQYDSPSDALREYDNIVRKYELRDG